MSHDIFEPAALVDVESVLRRRGHLPTSYGQITQVLYPEERMTDVLMALGQFEFVRHFQPEPIKPYLDAFAHRSFRKMVRQLMAAKGSWVAEEVLRQSAGNALLEYVALLERLQVFQRREGEARLTRPIDNIGPSLEHYVSRMCTRELRGAAAWGVTLEGLPRTGGDYDVLTWLDPSLVYIECKSAHPRDVTDRELQWFLQRSVELSPEVAILLVDTESSLDQLVNERLNRCLHDGLYPVEVSQPIDAQVDYPGVYFGHQRIYVTNTEPTILRQIRRCLQHYYALVKGRAFWVDFLPDFTSKAQEQVKLPIIRRRRR